MTAAGSVGASPVCWMSHSAALETPKETPAVTAGATVH